MTYKTLTGPAGNAIEKGDLESMQITDVRVRKVAKEGKLKAVVSITIDDEFVVHDIKVIEGEKGMFYRNAEQESSGRRI